MLTHVPLRACYGQHDQQSCHQSSTSRTSPLGYAYHFALSDAIQIAINSHIVTQSLPVREIALVAKIRLKFFGDIASTA